MGPLQDGDLAAHGKIGGKASGGVHRRLAATVFSGVEVSVAEKQPSGNIRILGIPPETDVKATDAAMSVCRKYGPTAARVILAGSKSTEKAEK